MSETTDRGPNGFSRRGFLKGTSLGVVAGALASRAEAQVKPPAANAPAPEKLDAGATHEIAFELNGQRVTAKVKTGHTLLETLRDQLDQTGTKLVCDMGSCGACTVILDGSPVNSCLVLAAEAQGAKVQTVEGLAQGDKLHPIQEAFVAEDALQCGFCTPGMLMACKAHLDRNQNPTRESTQRALAGNICRCGTYENIFRAVDRAAKATRGGR